jgi:eukaryotic-like serine/threonine-protein kinase
MPADFDAVILRCIAKDPAARYADVSQLDRALAGCAASEQWTDVDAETWWRAQPAEGSHAAPV